MVMIVVILRRLNPNQRCLTVRWDQRQREGDLSERFETESFDFRVET